MGLVRPAHRPRDTRAVVEVEIARAHARRVLGIAIVGAVGARGGLAAVGTRALIGGARVAARVVRVVAGRALARAVACGRRRGVFLHRRIVALRRRLARPGSRDRLEGLGACRGAARVAKRAALGQKIVPGSALAHAVVDVR